MKKTLLVLCVMCLLSMSVTTAFANKNSEAACPNKTIGSYTVEGKFIKETVHDSYYGFLVKTNDGKSYDIGIGNDTVPEFEGIKPGNNIKIPFYSVQSFDESTGKCVVHHYYDTEQDKQGSFSK